MIRAGILFLILGGGGAVVASAPPPMKSQLQATVTDLHGKPVAFRVVSLRGGLMVQGEIRLVLGASQPRKAERVRQLDTLQATTPSRLWSISMTARSNSSRRAATASASASKWSRSRQRNQ